MNERRDNGIMIAEVIDLEDPEGLARVKLSFPTLEDQESNWAPLVSPMAGSGRGFFFRPEVGDRVLVAFEHGEPCRPYVLGSLWSQAEPPPEDDGQPSQNNLRFIHSRSGHRIILDDTQGAEMVEFVDKDEARRVVIDSANSKILVECDSGDVEVKAGAGSVKVEATTVEVKASGNMTLEATGTMTIKGATVNIN